MEPDHTAPLTHTTWSGASNGRFPPVCVRQDRKPPGRCVAVSFPWSSSRVTRDVGNPTGKSRFHGEETSPERIRRRRQQRPMMEDDVIAAQMLGTRNASRFKEGIFNFLSCLDAHNLEETSRSMRRCRTSYRRKPPERASQLSTFHSPARHAMDKAEPKSTYPTTPQPASSAPTLHRDYL
jgi:hypothetical protein